MHDWTSGHKRTCCPGRDGDTDDAANTGAGGGLDYDPSRGVLLDELEIVTENEPPEAPGAGREAERSEEERLADYRKFVSSDKYSDIEGGGRGGNERASGMSEGIVTALEQSAKSDTQGDKFFRAFKRRVAREPEQVGTLRKLRNEHLVIHTTRAAAFLSHRWCGTTGPGSLCCCLTLTGPRQRASPGVAVAQSGCLSSR